MAADFNEPFTGSAGTSLTTSNTSLDWILNSTPLPSFVTAPGGRGGTCALLPTIVGGYTGIGWEEDIGSPITTGKAYARAYLYFTGNVVQWTRLFAFEDEQAAYLGNGFSVTSASSLTVRLYSLSGNSGSSYTLSTNTWYRMEIDTDWDAKTVQGRIYLGDATTPLSTQNATWTTIARTNVNGQADMLIVKSGGTVTETGDVYVDDVAFSTAAQPGPLSGGGATWAYHVIQG